MSARAVGWSLAIVGCLAYGGWGVSMITREGKAAPKARSMARALGMPITPADIPEIRFKPDRDAAPIYDRVAKLVLKLSEKKANMASSKSLPFGSPNYRPKPKTKTAADLLAEQDAALSDYRQVFAELEKVDQTDGPNFGNRCFNSVDGLFSVTVMSRTAAKELSYLADFQDRHGQTQEALKTLKRAYRISWDDGLIPTIMALATSVNGRVSVDKEYGVLLKRHQDDIRTIQAIAQQVAEEQALPDPRRALGGELVLHLKSLPLLDGFPKYGNANYSGEEQSKPSQTETYFYRSQPVQDALVAREIDAWSRAWRGFPKDSQDWQSFGAAIKAEHQ